MTLASPLHNELRALDVAQIRAESVASRSGLIAKRDAADDVCGINTGGKVASDTRTSDAWKQYNIDQWILDK